MVQMNQLQGRNRDTDVENKHMDTNGGKEGGMNCETGTNVYILIRIKYITNENLLHSTGNSTSLYGRN